MLRKRIGTPSLGSWDEVDASLKAIAEAENELAIIEAGMNIQVDAIKEAAEKTAKPYKETIKKHELMIKEYTSENRDSLTGKSRNLTFGKVGYRLSTKVTLPKVLDRVIKNLRKFDMEDCIVTKETVNKDVLKTYDEKDILKVGGKLKKEDTFYYEIQKDVIAG